MLSTRHPLKRLSTSRCSSTIKPATRNASKYVHASLANLALYRPVCRLWSWQRIGVLSRRSLHSFCRRGMASLISKDIRPNQRLAASILRSPAGLLMNDHERNAELTEAIYERLGLKQPAKLESEYTDGKSYHDALASLVVEETRFTIVSELQKRFSLKNRTAKSQASGVSIQVTGGERHFYEAWTREPLSSSDRNSFKAGAVFMMVPRGEDHDPKRMVLGTIQYGSKVTRILPREMQKDKEGKKEGDRLTYHLFDDDRDRFEGKQFEMHFIASILNFQRQFTACSMPTENASFEGELWGQKSDDGGGSGSDTLAANEIENASASIDDPSSGHGMEESEPPVPQTISVPSLNNSQRKAAGDFLLAKDQRIRIVQGPPGTGKTTMTVAIICRYILESKALGIKRKLLVCGPTNKSVVVLARKVLHCIKKDDSTNVVLIGDGDELLSDNRKELEKSFVFTYIQSLTRAWRRLTDRLLKDNDFNRFEDESGYLLSKMRKQIPTIRLRELETALMYVGEFFEESADGKDQGKSPTTYLKAIAKTIRELDQQMVVQDLLNSADVIFCTLSTTGSLPMRRMEPVSDLIVDEASASTEPELMIPLHTKPDKLLLVGDPRQLPATVKSPVATKFGLGQSLQERLMFDNRFDYTLLDVQYRMRPEISEWPMAEFYNEKVKDGDNVTTESYRADIVVQNGDPYTWVQVSGKEQKDIQFSTFNESEAQAVAALLLELKEKHNQSSNWFSPDKIRIITFYQAQVDNLRLLLRKYQLDVMVSTVDGSQGCEADIVILSFVRGTSGHMGFLKDNRRLNVVLTRAKFQLVCVGNAHAVADLEGKGGNIVLRKMATDALSRSDLVQAPSPLPPPPKRAPRKDNPKAKKVKNKKAKKKSKSTSKSQPEKIIEVDSV